MVQPIVSIVTSDRGWILEKLAQELSKKLDYVNYDEKPNKYALLSYYITYSSRKDRISPIEIGYFTHIEEDKETKNRFFDIARSVDYCVTQAQMYEMALREAGVATVETIPPGVDLDAFRPSVRIGVVGRTYHTGRKGEALVAAVMDEPGIEWRFTGSGWPLPSVEVPPDGMPAFYNDLDFVLVPALYEGGPMCVVEALACGVPVIAPPVGWTPDFPHREYRTGDAADLRRVLREVKAERETLRASVLDYGWRRWVAGHDALFRRLMAEKGLAPGAGRRTGDAHAGDAHPAPQSPGRVRQILHGSERGSGGGPTTRAPRLSAELRRLGVDADVIHMPGGAVAGAAVAHCFNNWPPESALSVSRAVRRAGAAFVFSPIYIDHGEVALWRDAIPAAARAAADPDDFEARLQLLRDDSRHVVARPQEAAPGHHEILRTLAASADHVIFLSELERRGMEKIGAVWRASTVIANPVDAARFTEGNAARFTERFGVRDFVLCVGRIEPRKNQLLLLHALREEQLPIVLIGHASNPAYARMLKPYLGSHVHLLGRRDPGVIADALAAARVFALPSFAEGAPLAALEAAASGAAMALSDRSSEQEYFGALADYCDPTDPASIRRAVRAAWARADEAQRRSSLRGLVARRFGWAEHARATLDAYREARAAADAAADRADAPLVEAPRRVATIVFDVTTTLDRTGRWTGITRVEASLARALLSRNDIAVRLIAWVNETRRFVDVSATLIKEDGALARSRVGLSAAPPSMLNVPPGTPLVVCGSAWMQNDVYAAAIIGLAREAGLETALVLHDLAPIVRPDWFDDGYEPRFRANMRRLIRASRRIIAISEATRAAVATYMETSLLDPPPLRVLREGVSPPRAPSATPSAPGRPFVLAVGAVHPRKNYGLLHAVWARLAKVMGSDCPDLVIVGGVGWKGGDVANGLRMDPRIAGRVRIEAEVDDDKLEALYRDCLMTVYPSLLEGWGLPVMESLIRGRICLASDCSSIPEIAPDCTDLLDPEDPVAWAARILHYARSAPARAAREAQIAERLRRHGWDDCAEDLLAILSAPAPAREEQTIPGQVVRINAENEGLLGAGWHLADSQGVWSAAQTAEIALPLAGRLEGDHMLALELRPPAVAATVSVTIAGRPIGSVRFVDERPTLATLRVPAEGLAGASSLKIGLKVDQLRPIPLTGSQNQRDLRIVGVWLGAVRISSHDAELHAGATAPTAPHELLLPVGETLDLGAAAPASATLGLKGEQRDGVGLIAVGGVVEIALPIVGEVATPLTLALTLDGLEGAARPLAAFWANGVRLDGARFGDGARNVARVDLPQAVRDACTPVALRIEAPGAEFRLGAVSVERAGGSTGRVALSPPPFPALPALDPGDIDVDRATLSLRRIAVADASAHGWTLHIRLAATKARGATRDGLPELDQASRARRDILATVTIEAPGHATVRGPGGVAVAVTAPPGQPGVSALIIDGAAIGADDALVLRIESASSIDSPRPVGLRLRAAPEDPFLRHVAVGDALRDAAAWDAAVEAYASALALRPDVGIQLQLGHMLKESGRFTAAMAAYETARRAAPEDAEVLFQIGHLHNRQGDHHAAAGFYRRAAALRTDCPDTAAHLRFATDRAAQDAERRLQELLDGQNKENKR